jgi:cephalosporin-C deacetylase-like acetyl esterase
MLIRSCAVAMSVLVAQAPTTVPTSSGQSLSFDYDAKPIEVQFAPAAEVRVRQLTYAQLDGTRNAATLVTPFVVGSVGAAAVLFVHWYEPPRPTSNRTEFLAEAIELGAVGVTSLLIDTPWTRESWFPTRDSEKDYDFSLQRVKELRRALDVLLAQPRIDKTRVALVGHDFGAMYGALATAADPRVTAFVYMAGTSSFTDWFLFAPRREGAARDAFVVKLAPLDPVKYLPKIAPRPVLLQFGTKDQFVKDEAAKAMADAITGPKTVKSYDFEHELTYQARLDRLEWLTEQLKVK